MKYFNLVWLRSLLRKAWPAFRGEPPALLEVNVPGIELVHVWGRFYYLRVDLKAICVMQQLQVEATDPDMIRPDDFREGRDYFVRRCN